MKLAAQPVPPRDPDAWLFRAIRNGAINAGIARRRRRRHEAEAAAGRRPWFEPDRRAGGRGRSTPSRPRRRSRRCPPGQREVIVAHLWGGLSFEQIADLAGTSSSSAHRLYHAGLTSPERTPGGAMSHEPVPPEPGADRDRGRAPVARPGPGPGRPRPRDVPGRPGLGRPAVARPPRLGRRPPPPRARGPGRGRAAGPPAPDRGRRAGGRRARAGGVPPRPAPERAAARTPPPVDPARPSTPSASARPITIAWPARCSATGSTASRPRRSASRPDPEPPAASSRQWLQEVLRSES